MNQTFQSPKNCKKTNPLEYDYYENVKERHYLGKYRPNKNDICYKNSTYVPEIETFNFNNNSSDINLNINSNNISNLNYNENNKISFAIKSTII